MSALDKLIAAVEVGECPDFCPMWHGQGLCVYAEGAFGGSLDDAKRLHEALLPDCGWDIWRTLGHMPNGESRVMYGCNLPMIDMAYSPTASRAWLLAILRAVKAKEAGNE
jgi:hypothetical protein